MALGKTFWIGVLYGALIGMGMVSVLFDLAFIFFGIVFGVLLAYGLIARHIPGAEHADHPKRYWLFIGLFVLMVAKSAYEGWEYLQEAAL